MAAIAARRSFFLSAEKACSECQPSRGDYKATRRSYKPTRGRFTCSECFCCTAVLEVATNCFQSAMAPVAVHSKCN